MKGYELYKELNLNLNPSDIDEILYHSSFQPQESYKLKKNKEYISWGNEIISLLISIYIYDTGITYEASEITIFTNKIYKNIVEAVYNEYDLEKYVYISKGEIENKHQDIASKLFALMYRTNGFLDTYKFILKFASTTINIKEVDYRTLLQEYAQGKKLLLEYKIVEQAGPAHDQIFTCELTVGSKKVLAKGRGKKDAYRLAAEKYIKENNIKINAPSRTKNNMTQSVKKQIQISVEREKQLIKLMNLLHIDKSVLPISYMNAAFVHRSIHNDMHFKDQLVDNTALNVIGAKLYNVFAYDYIYSTYEIDFIDTVRERSSLSDAMNLGSVLPEDWIKDLMTSKSIKSINTTGNQSLKIEIFKSIIGSLLLEAMSADNIKAEESAKNITFFFMDQIKKNKIPDYITPLQELAQLVGLKRVECVEEKRNIDGENTNLFIETLECSDGKRNFTSTGEGSTIKRAKNATAFEMLNKLLPYYEKNVKARKIILEVLYPDKYIELEKGLWKIRKSICVLSENNEGKKLFSTVSRYEQKDVYDISFWKSNTEKDGITFTASEAKQLLEILDGIDSVFDSVDEKQVAKIIKPIKESDPLIKEVIEGKESNLSSGLINNQKLEIIRAELLACNLFEGFVGNSTKLLPHQKAACRIAEIYDKFAFFYDTGTGKTVLALDIITSKFKEKKAKFLIICPKPIIQTAWMDDQKNFYPDMKLVPLCQNVTLKQYLDINRRWNKLEGRSVFDDYLYYEDWQSGSKTSQIKHIRAVIMGKANHYIVNPESFIRNIELYKLLNVDGVIIDESSILKNYSSKISRAIREFTVDCKFVYLLSGKPAPNNSMEYFSQMKVVAPDDFTISYDTFKNKYYTSDNGHLVCKSAESEKEVSNLIAKHSIIVSKEECLSLPETSHMVRKISLDKEIMRMYQSMYRDYFLAIEIQEKESKKQNKIYNVNNKLASLMKLRQLVSGFIIDNEGIASQVHKKKEEELLNVLSEIGNEQVIIWCQFKYEIVTLKKLLEEIGKIVVTAYSDTKDKDQSICLFKEKKADIIIAHPKTLQYGVTFVNCKYSIYYSMSYSFEEYYQSHDRIYRYGQKNICSFIFLQVEDTIDEVLFNCVQNKNSDAAIFELLIKDAAEHNVFE